jgi:hypothetical protein
MSLLARIKRCKKMRPTNAFWRMLLIRLLDRSRFLIWFPEMSKLPLSRMLREQFRQRRVSSKWSNLYGVFLK